jgi:hypothetical protein
MARARLLDRTATIALAGEVARIAVVADTHSRPHPDAARHLAALAPDAILHAGDIGDLAVLEALAAIAPLHVVRGNIDSHAPELPDQLTIDVTRPAHTPLRLLLLHIAVSGVRLRADIARTARARKAALVVCGHSHVPFIARDGEITTFNPGSIGPRRFHLPIVFGTIDFSATGVRLAHIDCETGKPWTPP